jgi:hypothetical protein
MRSLFILTVLITCCLQSSLAQEPTYSLRTRIVGGENLPATANMGANRKGALTLTPDTTLAFRMRNVRAQELADTSRFVPNRQGAWFLYNSYVAAAGRDSIMLEAVVSRSRDADWSQHQRFGRITDKKFWPRNVIEARYYLITDAYDIRIEKDGWCSIKLAEGQLPSTDPVVLPIRITFKGK